MNLGCAEDLPGYREQELFGPQAILWAISIVKYLSACSSTQTMLPHVRLYWDTIS